jgi:5'-3' exonuclease
MIYIVDFSYLYKRFKATGYVYTKKEGIVEYNAGYVVQISSALKLIKADNPGVTIYYALDGAPLRARALSPTYKLYRDKSDEPTPVYPVYHALNALNAKFPDVKMCFLPGCEADAVAASLVYLLRGMVTPQAIYTSELNAYSLSDDPKLSDHLRMFHGLNNQVAISPTDEEIVLCTSDADWYQLLDLPNIAIDKSLTLTSIDRTKETPGSVGGVKPGQIIAYKVLKGDNSDGIKGLNLKGFKALEYIRSVESSDQFEQEAFTTENHPLFQFLEKTNQQGIAYVNYLLTKLEFEGIPYII